MRRSAIALMITIFFVMAISLSLGLALKQVKDARGDIQKQDFLLQTNIILEDVLNILKNSAELEAAATAESPEILYLMLSQAAFIPFEHSGIAITLELKSARAKFNVNSLVDEKGTVNENRKNALINYLALYEVNQEYANILLDNISQVKEETYYNSGIFDEKPTLFRDYIVSEKHIDEINAYYMSYYNENSVSKLKFAELFNFSKDTKTKIDLNYASQETWRLLIGCEELRAEELSLGGGAYTAITDLDLSAEEIVSLGYFDTSYYEPFLDIRVEVREGAMSAKIQFEYDIKTKKGSNFVYEI